MQDLQEKIDLIAQMLETIAEYIDLDKGGPGSGRHPEGHNGHSGEVTDPTTGKPIHVPGHSVGTKPRSDERIIVGSKPVHLR